MWFAIYQISDGTLVSLATVVADPLPAGLAKKPTTPPPRDGLQWNTTLLDWEPEPAPSPDVDRVDEFIAGLSGKLRSQDEQKVRSALVALLGDSRFRDPTDVYEMGVR